MADRSLLTEEMFSNAIPEERAPLTEGHFEGGIDFAPQQKPDPKPISAPKGDILRAVTSQAALGAAADIPGTPGAISQLADLASEKLYKYGLLKPAEMLGMMPKGKTAEDFIKEAKALDLPPQYGEAEKKGKVSSAFGLPLPTPSGLEGAITEIAPWLDYKGVTPEAQTAGKLTRAGVSMLPGGGGLGPALGRFGAGVSGSGIGQAAERGLTQGEFISPEYRPYIEPVATMAGTLASLGIGRRFGDVFNTTGAAERQLSQAMLEDIRSGRVDPVTIYRAQNTDTPVSVADIFGKGTKTREYMEKQAGAATTTAPQVEGYAGEVSVDPETGVLHRLPEAQARIQDVLEQIHGEPINAPALQEKIQRSNKQTRSNIYDIVKSDPRASSISIHQIGPELIRHGMIADAVKSAMKTAATAPEEWNIRSPRIIPAKTPTPTGLLDESGRSIMSAGTPANEIPGNLAFWDQVKRELDREIRAATPSFTNTGDASRAAALENVRKKLVDQLDLAVPNYPRARNAAMETFKADTAPEAGVEFFKKMDAFKRQDALNAFREMSPESQELFRSGWMHSFAETANTPSGISSLAKKFAADANFQGNAHLMLGNDYHFVRGKILSENLRNKASAVQPAPFKGSLALGAGKGAIAAAVTEYLMGTAIQASMLAPEHIGAATVGAALGLVSSGARQIQAHRIANKVVPLMLSEDPRDMTRLSELMDADPATARTVANMNAIVQGSQQPRATGGRIYRASGGRASITVDSLMRAVEDAKKHNQNQTKVILAEPDEHVVHALKIANDHI